jgi:hypothetical protein
MLELVEQNLDLLGQGVWTLTLEKWKIKESKEKIKHLPKSYLKTKETSQRKSLIEITLLQLNIEITSKKLKEVLLEACHLSTFLWWWKAIVYHHFLLTEAKKVDPFPTGLTLK